MTLKQQAQRELSRIKKSMLYREKKYGIKFPSTKEDISKRILGREAKAYTKRDIAKLKQIKGGELYRFGEAQIGGETVKGYATEQIAKDIQYTNRKNRATVQTPKTPTQREWTEPKPLIPLSDDERKAIREQKLKQMQEGIERQEKQQQLVASTDQIISDFLNPTYWRNMTEKANRILNNYINTVLLEYSKEEVANAIELASASGDLTVLRTSWYKIGMTTALEEHLGKYFGHSDMLLELDDEMQSQAEESEALSDFEMAMGLFEGI